MRIVQERVHSWVRSTAVSVAQSRKAAVRADDSHSQRPDGNLQEHCRSLWEYLPPDMLDSCLGTWGGENRQFGTFKATYSPAVTQLQILWSCWYFLCNIPKPAHDNLVILVMILSLYLCYLSTFHLISPVPTCIQGIANKSPR